MTEWVTYGSVGGAAGNSRSYPELVVGPDTGTMEWTSPHLLLTAKFRQNGEENRSIRFTKLGVQHDNYSSRS